jgi:hypothetical protein
MEVNNIEYINGTDCCQQRLNIQVFFPEDGPEENLVSAASAPLTQSSLFFLTRKLV